jgi:hypothetical protein
MKRALLLSLIFTFVSVLTYAETNATTSPKEPEKAAKQKEHNTTKKSSLMEKKIKEQMEREKKYAKEQKFYQGDAYDLKAHEVDPNSLPDVKEIEPDYDFDITDVYRDDI